MSEENFNDLFLEETVTRQSLRPGDRVQAVVAAISGENIFLDIGLKSEGILSAAEVKDEEGNIPVSIGEKIDVFLLSTRGGEMVFTTRIGAGQASVQELEDAFHSGIPVEGKVTEEVKGGFSVTIAGTRAFCPYSQMDIRRVEDPESYIDQSYSFKIMEFSNRGRNIILSARAVLEEQRELMKQKLQETLEEGMQVSGIVTSIRDFGAFVDIGGVDGLIPVSELAWGQTDRVEDIVQRGQEVEVIIKRLDWEAGKISLSLRETKPNPWNQVAENYPIGSTVTGTICRLTAFGAFVTLEPGVDGLIHISKLGAGRRIHHPREVVEAGQELTVKIDSVDTEKNRISLLPADYNEKNQPKKEKEQHAQPTETFKPSTPQSMGTLGDLLKAQMTKKK